MRKRSLFAAAALILMSAACSPSRDGDSTAQAPAAAPPPASAPTPAPAPNPAADPNAPYTPPAPGQPGGLADDRTPLAEGPIDPKSAQGAAQVVQTYFALIEEKTYDSAWALWGGHGEASNQTLPEFTAGFGKYAQYHANIGKPGDTEGGAGSIYVDVPVQIYGRLTDGTPFNLLGTVSLRRVNDVDGSTAEQRKWHIIKIDVKQAP
jgi:hypothetical protein